MQLRSILAASAAAAIFLFCSSARAGVVPDFTARGSQPGLVHDLQSSANCQGCHSNGPLEFHYPGTSWKGSMMANSGRDPVFWAALDVANADAESLGMPGVGEWCLRCHSPEGWFAGRVSKTGDGGRVDGADGCLLQGDHDDPPGFGNDYAGVGCHYCHRSQKTGPLGEPFVGASGDVWLDDVTCAGGSEPCRAGPYDYTDGTSPPPHPWKYSEHLQNSEMCGSCHDISSPLNQGSPLRTLIDAAGVDTGRAFPLERTFSEWLHSDHGTALFADGVEAVAPANLPGRRIVQQETCQDCHMPVARSEDPEDEFLGCFFGPNRNGELSVHTFSGANTWVPNILRGEYPALDYGKAFTEAIAQTTSLLSERSAELAVSAVRSADGTGLDVQVRVTNLAGHKLPTGYSEGRRMWLELEVRDASQTLIYRSGQFDPATGDPVMDEQVRVYEVKQGIWDADSGTCRTTDAQGRATFHFVLNNCIAKDNRIPPLGFTGGDDIELHPVGAEYPPEQPGGARLRNYDEVTYSVPIGSAIGALGVSARLHYQTASSDYITFLRDQAVERGFPAENSLCADGPGRPFDVGPQSLSRGAYLFQLWSNPEYGRSPAVQMAHATATVPAAAPAP